MTQRFSWNPPAWPTWVQWHWYARSGDMSSLGWRRQRGPAVIPAPSNITASEQQELYDAAWLILTNRGPLETNYSTAMIIAMTVATKRDEQMVRRPVNTLAPSEGSAQHV